MALVRPRNILPALCLAALSGCTSAAVVGDSADASGSTVDAPAALDVGAPLDRPDAVAPPDAPTGFDTSRPPDMPAAVDAPLAPDVPATVDAPLAPDVPATVDAPATPDVPTTVDAPATPDVPVGSDAATARDAPDAPDGCTAAGVEVCDGVDNNCNGQIDEGFCRIDGVCFTHLQRNPANACQACTLTSSTLSGPTTWSNVPAGTVCRSAAGACDVAEACAGTGAPCPADQLAAGGATTYDRTVSPLTFLDACAAPGSRRALVAADQAFTAEGLPFSFRFFGAPQLLAVIAVNGMVSFSSAAATAIEANTPLPHAAIPSTIFALWDDLQTQAPGVCVATVGAAPDRRFVVEWRDAGFCCGTNPGTHLDFEVVLTESSNTIDVLYRRLDDATDRATGSSATIGIQNADASAFDLVAFNAAGTLHDGSSYRWTPRGPVVCRASTGACDPAEVCTGTSTACPGNGFTASTTMCRPPAGGCDTLERCTGSGALCPADAFMSTGTACGTGLVCASAACCPPGVTPAVETCNNLDDDCNGIIDDGVTRDCYSGATGTVGVGTCRLGVQSCAAGAWGACGGEVGPRAEVCDRLDNNCNGTADEGILCP